MCEIYPLLDFLEIVIMLLTAFVSVDLLVYHSVYLIIDRYLPLDSHYLLFYFT